MNRAKKTINNNNINVTMDTISNNEKEELTVKDEINRDTNKQIKKLTKRQQVLGKQLENIENGMINQASKNKDLVYAILSRLNKVFNQLYSIAYTDIKNYHNNNEYNQTLGSINEMCVWLFIVAGDSLNANDWYQKLYDTAKEYYQIPYLMAYTKAVGEKKIEETYSVLDTAQ